MKNSVIKNEQLPDLTVLSGKWTTSRSATGHLVKEPYTADLSCQIGDRSFSHAFLVTTTCPCNLLRRDLMCKLKLNLYCDDSGLTADMSMVRMPTETLYVFEWSTPQCGLQNKATNRMPPDHDFMEESDLHCTCHVSNEPDEIFAEKWSELEIEELKTSELVWSDKWCAVKVELTDSQASLYDVEGAVPHIFLAKPQTAEWREWGFL